MRDLFLICVTVWGFQDGLSKKLFFASIIIISQLYWGKRNPYISFLPLTSYFNMWLWNQNFRKYFSSHCPFTFTLFLIPIWTSMYSMYLKLFCLSDRSLISLEWVIKASKMGSFLEFYIGILWNLFYDLPFHSEISISPTRHSNI